MSEENDSDKAPITIKKYANRRLYNTATSSYVTLDHLATMVKEGVDFVVYDAKTGDDITRQVLTHIIVEEEGKGQNLLPINFLRHLISFYGDSLQSVIPNYLDHSMQSFAHNQEQMRDYMQNAMGGLNPFGQFEDFGKKNMAMFEDAMKMFNPFMPGGPEGGDREKSKPEAAKDKAGAGKKAKDSGEMDDLRDKLELMQRQIDQLTGGGKD
ncbi:MAG: polyhydroxyalkanoate synthesis repressor PhaR [Rhodospirillales bacterium]|nr:polyhydroxyalkanoate synthesis repressor PhaR [Rhodospirillales bacterium]